MFRHAKKLSVVALVGSIALVGAACEVEDDDPDVVEETTQETDIVEDEETVTEEETTTETETETETTAPTETES